MSMKKVKLTRARQDCFLKALAETGVVSTAVAIAGTSRTRVYELRKRDTAFADAWDEAEEKAADALEAEAWRRGVAGVQEPVVSGGKVVRDDDGHPIAIRRYSDNLLLALLKARRPEKFREQRLVEHKIDRDVREIPTEELVQFLEKRGVGTGPEADNSAVETGDTLH